MSSDKNINYLSWDEAFIALSKLVSLRSKDRYRKSGSCIVDDKNRIMSLGYNGLPFGCEDEVFPNQISESLYNDKNAYTVPSIINAILIARRNLEGCTLYTTDFPTPEETKMILQYGLDAVRFINKDNLNEYEYKASIDMLNAADLYWSPIDDLEVTCGDKKIITWDEAFVGVSKIVAMRSKDPNTQVGSCIVDSQNRIVSLGYNGLPFGCDDNEFPWAREGEYLCDTKYPYVVHAEPNAISIAHSTSPKDLTDTRMYVTLFPCHNCAAQIIQAGIKEILYVSDKYADTDGNRVAKRMLDARGVIYHPVDDVDVVVRGYQKTIRR